MKEPRRRRGLSGTVLIMILTVMTVLIIMLMATLTVVTTANQRVYTKFEENQAYYSARSALDVFTNNFLVDGAYYAYDSDGTGSERQYWYSDDSQPSGDNHVPMKQGLALQLDLYKIKSKAETAAKEGYSLDFAENAVLGDGTFVTGSREDQNYSMANATGLPYIEYDVKFPAVSDGSSAYGNLVDTDRDDLDGDGETDDQVAMIRVEVLDRVYATNPLMTKADIASKIATPAGKAEVQSAIQNGKRTKDYMKLKITSTVKIAGVDGVAIVILETTERESPSADKALTTTGRFAGGGGAQLRVGGGVASMDLGDSAAGDGNDMSGSVFTLGTLNWTSSAHTKINKDEIIVAMGGISPSSNITDIEATADNTFVFLGGTSTLSTNSASTIGRAAHKVPVISNEIIAGSMNNFGDMYITKATYTDSNNGKWNLNGSTMYVRDLVIPNNSFFHTPPGDEKGVLKLGQLLGGGSLTLCQGYNIYLADDLDNPVNLANYIIEGADTTSLPAAFDINTFAAAKEDGKIYREYTLPFQVNGSNVIKVPTAQSFFGEFFLEDAFDESTGDLKMRPGGTPSTDYADLYDEDNKDYWLLTGADMLATYLELPESETRPTMTSMIADGQIPGATGGTLEAFPTGDVTINLDSGDQFYLLKGDYSNCHWTVTGSNGRLILVIPEGSMTSGNFMETNEWGGTSLSSAAWSNYTVKFDNCTLETADITTSTGSLSNGGTKAPRIDIYGGTGSELLTSNQNFFAGYFMMPTGYVYLNNGKSNVSYDNGNGATTGINNVAIVGSMLCSQLMEANQSGVVYINKDSGADSPGEPHLQVAASRYSRN